MRTEPTWRIPVGILVLIVGLTAYGLIIARYVPVLVGAWHVAMQTVVYGFLGVAWLWPMGRFLQWMETGRWRR